MSEFKSPNPPMSQFRDVLTSVAAGNQAAYDYMGLWIKSLRGIDNLFDEPEDWTQANTYELAQWLMVEMPGNVFFNSNMMLLWPMHVTVLNAWRDSNDWKQTGDKSKNLHALAMAEQISDLFILVAYLTGGYDHMRQNSLKVRELFLKQEVKT